MREHLYRGKTVDNNKWVHGNLLRLSPTRWAISDEYIQHGDRFISQGMHRGGNATIRFFEVKPETIGEYTGMKTNGINIFEGDIVRYKWEDKSGIDEIVFEYSVFRLKNNMPLNCFNDLKVIGNIHDNPELLKTKADIV